MKKTRLHICIFTAGLLAALFLLCGFVLMKPASVFAAESNTVSSYCPQGSANVSLNKPVKASSSYEKMDEGWAAAFLTDGMIGTPGVQPPNGWSTEPNETTDPNKVAWASVDLQAECTLSRIVLFPRNDHADNYGECFPVDFELQVSSTGKDNSWETVKKFEDFQKPTQPLTVDFEENVPSASYVRLYVTERIGADNFTGGTGGNDGKLVQISEMAVFGNVSHATLSLNKTALKLKVGAVDRITPSGIGASELIWKSDDEAVASVSPEGVITAKSVGNTMVRVSGEGFGEQTVSVSVVEKKFDFDENITISVFWLPTKTYLEGGVGDERWDEQFKLLADADVDWLAHVTDNENSGMLLTSKEDNLKAAEYADKYGMYLTVADTRFGQNLLNMDDGAIASLIEEYRNVPGVGGYYIWDEPAPTADLSPYARVYAAMKQTDPDAYAHLNFLPMYAYQGGEEAYRKHVSSWLDATQAKGVPQDYIMYDYYPYTGFGEGMDRENFFSHLDAMRRIGLDYGVKTATYLQSNGSDSKRCPSPSEIRYQAMASLAYGYKQLSYFTWFLPTNRSETFHDAIVSDKGVPNAVTYDAVSKLNREIHNLGATLAKLDSVEVYLNGPLYGGQLPVPDDFVFQSMDDVSYTVSLMKDKITGRNYVMLVNNDFTDPMETSVFFGSGLRSLQQVSPEDGRLKDVALPGDGTLTISLEAGDAVLYALPEGMDFTAEQTVDRTAADEILARAESERGGISANDAALLDEAVGELREALGNVYTTQARLDELTEKVKNILDNAEKVPPEEPAEEKKGCGGMIGAAAGGGISLALLLAALLLVKKKKKKRE